MTETTSTTSVSVADADQNLTEAAHLAGTDTEAGLVTETEAGHTEVEAGHAEVEAGPAHTDSPADSIGTLPIEPRTEPHVAPIPARPVRPVRLPGEHDPAPNHGRMLLLSVWTAILVLVGLVAAARIFAAILLNSGPGWLVPASVTIGVLGVIAAGVAFASIHRAVWALTALGASTAALAVNLTLVLVFL